MEYWSVDTLINTWTCFLQGGLSRVVGAGGGFKLRQPDAPRTPKVAEEASACIACSRRIIVIGPVSNYHCKRLTRARGLVSVRGVILVEWMYSRYVFLPDALLLVVA